MCPGRHFALRTLYLVIACVLSTFDIEPTLDDDGNPHMPKAEFHSVVIRYVFGVIDFRCWEIERHTALHQGP